jgi:hypothetical protein
MAKIYRRLLPLGLLINLFVLPVQSFVVSRAINIKVPTKAPVVLRSKSPLTQDETAATTKKASAPTKASLSLKDLEGLNTCQSKTQAERLLEKNLFGGEDNKTPLGFYKSISIPPSASVKGISDGDLAIQTRLSNKKYQIMDLIEVSGDRDADRASLGLLCVMVGSTLTALTAQQNLPGPDIIRFLVVLIFTFAPLAFVGYGIATPDKLQTALVVVQREFFPAYRTRMIHHEAGHFLMGHLLGLPVAGYQANAVKNAVEFYPLSDKNRGLDRASLLGFDKPKYNARDEPEMVVPEDVPFFSTEGLGGLLLEEQSVFRNAKNYSDNPFLKLASQNEPTNSWPFRGFDHRTVDQLAVVSLGGVCAEILAFGNAEGGIADLGQLRQFFGSAEPKLTDSEMENIIRFSLGYTLSQLRRNLGALDALVSVMERGGSVAECVLAIESCENASGQDGVMGGDYELLRRQAIRSKAGSLVEMLFLGGERNVDTEKEGMVQGKGGGYKEEKKPLLTGDDPLYVAIAVAFGFFIWASTGGLSLH